MKKGLFIVPLAVCAMAITSCGAPTVSKEVALQEANSIRQSIEESGDYVAGKKFQLITSIEQNIPTGSGIVLSSTKGEYNFDIDNNYCGMISKTTLQQSGVKQTTEEKGYVYLLDGQSHIGFERKINGEVADSQDLVGDYVPAEFEEAILSIYESITEVFETAVVAIFTYLNSFPSDEALKAAGVTLGSYGAGSLVIEEHINNKAGGYSAKSDTVIEFKDYKLKEMKSTFDYKLPGNTSAGNLSYVFNYGKCNTNIR